MISCRKWALVALFSCLAARGLDPNVWFDNVELIAAEDIGRETVDYMANIYKYYLAFELSRERSEKQ